ncbi:DEAD/DEAH box helicase [Alsobacter metallidurans]|uniref:DEAD-box ATP-dependent RNA helicase RhpA n=1 Tax=Alsobacter metallidurans TaxID=340221 RepID=A0A917I9C2_9HYPH|nr:DEAD/DEAH box helicase [Alsobacter metallidurans]GGH22274.1 DEAD/DEAH box helicase [Alsobacter metallidurans]
MNFSDLGLSEKVLEAVTASGYTTPTPIQAEAIPHALARRDVLGIAQTGTGKTAAFTLPMLTMLEQGRARARMPRTLILEPTRELAAQVEEAFVKYGANQRLNVALLIGGMSFGDQDAKITRGVDVLIATPGRLLDHFERGKLLLTGIEILVIDEADRMLDMGFIPDIERICRMVPFTRQTLFFSATMPPEIQRLTETFLHNPAKIEVARQASTASTITQRLVGSGPEPHDKRDVLRQLIRQQPDFKNAIIFCNRKRDVHTVYRSLEKHGFSVTALHGDLDQRARMAALDSFRNGSIQLLVASDVAARGLDIPDVSHVFNYDVPHHAEDYVHRIGRTGRAGKSGVAISIVTGEDKKNLAAIEHMIGATIEWQGEMPAAGDGEGERRRRPGGRRPAGRDRTERSDRPRREEISPAAAEAQPRRERSRTPQRESAPERAAAPDRDEALQREALPSRERAAERAAGEARPPRRDRQPPGEARQERPQRPPRRPDPDDAPVVGLGDHVPSFLLRSVKR